MDQLAGRLLPGLLVAHLDYLFVELIQNEGGSLAAPRLGDNRWSPQAVLSAALLSDPLLQGPVLEVLAGNSGASLPLSSQAQPAVPATAMLLKHALHVLRMLTTASPTHTSSDQIADRVMAVRSAQLMLYLCVHAAVKQQQSRRELAIELGQETLCHALDGLTAVTTWFCELLLQANSPAVLLSDSGPESVVIALCLRHFQVGVHVTQHLAFGTICAAVWA